MAAPLPVATALPLPTPLSRRDLLAAAEGHARRGWVPLALVPGTKRPQAAGWPAITLGDWRRYWSPEAGGVGVQTGAHSALLVVDIDLAKGGMERWRELTARHGEPATARVRTGSGGLHYYFAWDARAAEFKSSVGCVLAADGAAPVGIDVRAEGGQVVAPPTLHPTTGQPYAFEADVPLAPLPDWLYAELSAGARATPARRAPARGAPAPGARRGMRPWWA